MSDKTEKIAVVEFSAMDKITQMVNDLLAENERLRAEKDNEFFRIQKSFLDEMNGMTGENASLRAEVAFLQAQHEMELVKLLRALAMLEKSTNLLNELLYEPSIVLGAWYDGKIIYQIAENQAVLVLQPTEVGEK